MEEEKKVEETKADIEIKRMSRILKVMFTDKERLAMGDQMANAVRNIKQVKDELDAIKAQYGSKSKALEAEIANVSERLNSGWEMKSVECEEQRDFRVGSVLIVRVDTREIIEERAMTFEERQGELPFKEKEPEPGPTVAEAQGEAQSEAGERMAEMNRRMDEINKPGGEVVDAEFTTKSPFDTSEEEE